MSRSKKREPRAERNMVVLGMLLNCKPGKHRNSQDKRQAQKERRVERSAW